MTDIRLRMRKSYDQESLLNDGSVSWKGHDREALLARVRGEGQESRITRLRHPEVRYEVTDHCNAECIMCPRDEHEFGRPHGTMDTENCKRSIDEVVELGCKQVLLQGFGEPLIDKKLEDKMEYAKSKGLRTFITSNASLMTRERSRRLIEAGLDELRISFYGMRKESYETVMVGLNFEKTMENMTDFLDLRRELGLRRPRLDINWLVLPENEGDTEQFREYWEPRADAIEIWKPHNFGDGRTYRERYDEISMKNTCGRPENGPLQIEWNGEVIPCCYDYNNRIVLGNAFEQPVLDILNGDKYNLLRMSHKEKQFGIFPYCDQCDQLLPHTDALIYTNRHNLPKEEAVKMTNTYLYNILDDKPIDPENVSEAYTEQPDGTDPDPKAVEAMRLSAARNRKGSGPKGS